MKNEWSYTSTNLYAFVVCTELYLYFYPHWIVTNLYARMYVRLLLHCSKTVISQNISRLIKCAK